MKKASLFASAAVASLTLSALPALAQTGPAGPFADVPADHFAYESVEKLRNRGIVIGYPDGTYGGRRAMTRYEFAVAIARLLDQTTTTQPGTFVTPEQLQGAIAGLATRDDLQQLRNLVTEFQNELTTLGVDLDAVRRRLDGLEGRVARLEDEVKRVRISGAANLMVRTAQRRSNSGQFVDYDGFTITTPNTSTGLASDLFSTFAETRVLHDIDLNVTARLSETANARVRLNFGNYLPFLTSIVNFEGTRIGTGVNQSQEQTVYEAMIEAPIRLPGIGGVALSAGRIPVQFTPYTLKQIDVDSYFYNDKTDLGEIPVDGARGVFKLGPVGVTALAAKVDPIKHVSNINGENQTDVVGYGLYAGSTFSPFAGGFQPGGRPAQSSVRPDFNGAMAVENLAAVRATFGASRLGSIGGTYMVMSGQPLLGGVVGTGNELNRVYVYGGDLATSLGPVGINASYTQSDSKLRVGSDDDLINRRTEENYAYDIAGNVTFGAINVQGGYRYIAPFFAAPGYWGKLGSYTNPVDIKGPYVRANYALGGGFVLSGEGNFYEGTNTELNGALVGLSDNEGITNFKAGLKYGLTSATAVDLGAEYTEYDLGGGDKPREVFYNIGLGYSFNPTTSLKFLYQIVDFSDKGTGFDPVNGDGAIAAAQFSVKF